MSNLSQGILAMIELVGVRKTTAQPTDRLNLEEERHHDCNYSDYHRYG
jgi:hypothetical protein